MDWKEALEVAWEKSLDSGGIVFWDQLMRGSINPAVWAYAIEQARIEKRRRGAYVMERAETRLQQLRQAVALLPRGVVSHEAAAVIHGFPGFDSNRVVVTVHSGTTHDLDGVIIRRNTDLREAHTEQHKGIPVTNRLRTIVDLAYEVGYEHMAELLDLGRKKEWFSLAEVEDLRRQICRRGKPGSAHLRRYLLAHRWDIRGHAREEVVSKFAEAGLPTLTTGVRIPWSPMHRFSLANEGHRIGIRLIESSARHPGWNSRYRCDDEQAREAGWNIFYLSSTDIALRLEVTVSTIRALLLEHELV